MRWRYLCAVALPEQGIVGSGDVMEARHGLLFVLPSCLWKTCGGKS